MRVIKIGLLCAALGAGAGSAWAGHPQERNGFWFGVGAGYGSAGQSCDDCDDSGRESGVTGFAKLGGRLSDRVLLGAEMNVWTKEEDGVSLNLYNAAATVTFYPKASSGFFLKGGAGISFVDADFKDGSVRTTVDLGTGLGLIAGAGYDVRVAKNFSVTPAFNYYWGSPGDLKVGSQTVVTGFKHNVLDFNVGVTFH
jgi:hypothetical protein